MISPVESENADDKTDENKNFSVLQNIFRILFHVVYHLPYLKILDGRGIDWPRFVDIFGHLADIPWKDTEMIWMRHLKNVPVPTNECYWTDLFAFEKVRSDAGTPKEYTSLGLRNYA